MARKSGILSKLIAFVAWVTGVLVSLVVGFGMINKGLTIPWLTELNLDIITVYAGWVVVTLTIIGVVLSLVNN